jgi:hypothetical protein
VADVYTVKFCDVQLSAGGNVYTVPSGKVAVLRYVSASFPSAGAFGFLRSSTGIVNAVHLIGGTSLFYQEWQGRAVFNALEIINFTASAYPAGVFACGYLLNLP